MEPADIVKAAVRAAGPSGRFRRADLAALRGAVAALGSRANHPRELFGPWGELPEAVRTALRATAEAEIERTMAYLPRGRMWPAVARRLRAASFPGLGLPAGVTDLWGARVWRTPTRVREAAHRTARVREWRHGSAPGPAELLAALGRTPAWLLGDYAEGVRVDPRARGYFHDRSRRVTWGYLTGVDLIPTDDGVFCVEANLNTAFNDERRAVMDPEPSVRASFELGERIGARTLWWHDMDLSPTPDWVLEELSAGARRAGMGLVVAEDARVTRRTPIPAGLPVPVRRLGSPTAPPEDTLVVRRNELPVGSDPVLSDKGLFTRAMHTELERAGETRVRVLPMTRVPEVRAASSDSLPNLVYKYPDRGKGEGVFFMNARDTDHALAIARELDRRHGEPAGLFQEFRRSRLLPGRRIYDVRAEILITPLGVEHCFSIRRESMSPLPEWIGEGLLEARGVFTSNLATGGRFAPIDPSEEEELRRAALAVGETLARAFERTFVTRG